MFSDLRESGSTGLANRAGFRTAWKDSGKIRKFRGHRNSWMGLILPRPRRVEAASAGSCWQPVE